MDREDAARLVEVSRRESRIVREELPLKGTEANHVVATPVLPKELTSTLIENLLERRIMVDGGCLYIAADLVEEALRCVAVRCLSTTCDGLSLLQQDVGIAEDRQVVALVTFL